MKRKLYIAALLFCVVICSFFFGYLAGSKDCRLENSFTSQDSSVAAEVNISIETEKPDNSSLEIEPKSISDPAPDISAKEELPVENENAEEDSPAPETSIPVVPIKSADFIIPTYCGTEVVQINNNTPSFPNLDGSMSDYVVFSELDSLGRCGVAEGYLGPDILATEERGSIGMIKPSGWHTVKYDFVDGKYLYNRCHLIAFELCGINDDERNLITGTRYLNLDGMLNYENQVCWYIRNSGNHVYYRVTPWYEGDNLVASGVQIEARSVEDNGNGICLNVFCFNVQPGVVIDYLTGESYAELQSGEQQNDEQQSETGSRIIESEVFTPSEGVTYILNTNTMRFHLVDCQSVQDMKDSNRQEYFGSREELIEDGYVPCGRCHP